MRSDWLNLQMRREAHPNAICAESMFESPLGAYSASVILPFLAGCDCRNYAARLRFWVGVIAPMPIFDRSLLYVHNHRLA